MALRGIREMFTRDVLVMSLTQLWRLVSGPVSMLLIPFFLQPDIQGFWYTFGSISALSVFADLGFTWIIMQFSAHEFAQLSFDDKKSLIGPAEASGNLSSLFRFVLRWTGILVAIVFPIIFFIGVGMFSQKASASVWMLPWIIFSISAAIQFMNSSVSSFTMGCDQVASIQVVTLVTSMLTQAVMFTCLALGVGLMSIAICQLSGNLAFTILLGLRYRRFYGDMLKSRHAHKKWGRDILNLLWRYALSWSSGYLIFSIYTPFMFQFHGAVEAGRVGLTINLVTAMFTLSNTWLSANTPKMNMLVAKKNWVGLDGVFLKNLLMTLGTYFVGILVLVSFVLSFSGRLPLFDKLVPRFLGVVPLAMLIACWLFQIVVNALAVYMRAHKEEPMVIPSIVMGIYIAVTTYLSAKFLPTDCFFLGFLTSFAFMLPWTVGLFYAKRRHWHAASA